MELMKGYKQTEVGVVPGDWNLEELGDCLLSHPKYGIGAAASSYNDALPTYLRITDISEDGKFIHENKSSVNHTNSHEYILENGEIVFARTGASVGKSYLYNISDGILIYAGFLIKVKPDPSKLNSYFLKNIVTTKHFWNWIGMVSMRSGQPGINSNQLNSFILPIPPIKEQNAIAQALLDTDRYITGLEKLIEKKHQIKQGAMQELLKPKVGWEVKKLGDLGACLRGVSYNPERDLYSFDELNTIRLLRSNNIQNSKIDTNGLQFVDKLRVKRHQIIQDNDIIICMANGSKQLVGKAAKFKNNSNLDYTYGAFMGCFRTDANIADSSFVYYNFLTNSYRNYIDVLLSGSSINNLNPKNIESIEICLPRIEVQKEISETLLNFDLEIDLLNEKIEKAKSLKQGMMQNLLTGKIRLI